MRRIFFYTTLLFVLMVQYPLVSFAEKRNLIFTANKVNPAQDPRDKFQRTIYVIEDPNEITPEDKIEFTPIGGGDIILKKSRTSNQS